MLDFLGIEPLWEQEDYSLDLEAINLYPFEGQDSLPFQMSTDPSPGYLLYKGDYKPF